MTEILDRRNGSKDKSVNNRHRFIQRVRGEAKKVVKDNVINGKIEDIINKKNYPVTVKKKAIQEPEIIYQKGSGNTRSIHVGNKHFDKGDLIPKPPEEGEGNGSGNNSGQGEDGEDDFQFLLSQEEFISLFFDDLELPRLFKQKLLGIDQVKWQRGGISRDGIPPRLNYVRTLRQSMGRRAALKKPKEKALKELEELLQKQKEIKLFYNYPSTDEKIRKLEVEIAELKRKIGTVPYLDYVDLRYNRITKITKPNTQAVMFLMMDISGSMGEWEKEMAKRFYLLLYVFLKKVYKKVELVFITYHGRAKEVDEHEFFYGRETGGTVCSPAVKIMEEKILEKYSPSDWNIYCCHASDGDNTEEDTPLVIEGLERVIPMMQYYAYVQIANLDMYTSVFAQKELWSVFKNIEKKHPNVGVGAITALGDIWPVFRKLFEKNAEEQRI